MSVQVKEKNNVKKPSKRGKSLTLTLSGIPATVNDKMKVFQTKISYERRKKFNLKDSYIEFLKDATKAL